MRLERVHLITLVADGCLLLALALIQLLIEDMVIVKLLTNIHIADVQVSQLIMSSSLIASIIVDSSVLYIGHIPLLLLSLLTRVRNVDITIHAHRRLLKHNVQGFLNVQTSLRILIIRFVVALRYSQVDLSFLCGVDQAILCNSNVLDFVISSTGAACPSLIFARSGLVLTFGSILIV